MSRRQRVAAALVALLALASPAAASGAAVTQVQMHALTAAAAAGSSTALTQLKAVTEVDGRPAQIARALNTTDPTELHARLEALASSAPPTAGPPPSSAAAQRTAASILAARQYGKAPVPDPVKHGLDDIVKAIEKLASRTPGGPAIFWLIVGASALTIAAFGARRMMRRLDPQAQAAAAAARSAGEDPAALERAADTAEGRGAFADAIRLRFRAGLLRLSARRRIEYRPSLLTTDVADRLHSSQFDALAATFDRVAYGGASAAQSDAAAARDGWRELLAAQRESA